MNRVYNTDSGIYTDERFSKLSEKLNKLQCHDPKQPTNKLTGIESRLDFLEVNILRTMKDFEYKSKFLRDEVTVITKMIEEQKMLKESLQSKIGTELVNLDIKIQSLFESERENLKIFAENMISTIEEEVLSLKLEIEKDKEELMLEIHEIDNFIKGEMMELSKNVNENSEKLSKEQEGLEHTITEEFKYINNILEKSIINRENKEQDLLKRIEILRRNVKIEFEIECDKRAEFEEKIFNTLQITIDKIKLNLDA